ncbi:MAG TPA: hypothetical protein VGE24_12710 [Emticicia sp.]
MNQELHIHNPTTDIVIRTGAALPVKEPIALRLSGDINTPKEFYQKRISSWGMNSLDAYNSKQTSLTINKKEGKITLVFNEQDPYYGQVEGKLTLNPLFGKLKVNEDSFQGFTPAELAKILRMNRQYFHDLDFFNNLVKNLQNFNAKFDTEITESNDKRGNIANSVIKKLVSEHNYNFALTLPVYECLENTTVPIEVDITYGGDSSIRCQLISVELVELQESIKKGIFDQYTVLFKDFPVILQ